MKRTIERAAGSVAGYPAIASEMLRRILSSRMCGAALAQICVLLVVCSLGSVRAAESTVAGPPPGAMDAAEMSPERIRANFGRPVTITADDVRAFPDAPAGFDKPGTNGLAGRTVVLEYNSTVAGAKRKAVAYLPSDYSADTWYPVIDLLHGIGSNEWEWSGHVHGDAVVGNLITAGKATPMIIVMPNGRALPDDRPPASDKMFSQETTAGFGKFERDLLDCLIPAIQAKYSTAPNRKALENLTASPRATKKYLKLMYPSCGNKDGLFAGPQERHVYLKEHNFDHVWNVDKAGHDRDTGANNLHHFAQRILT